MQETDMVGLQVITTPAVGVFLIAFFILQYHEKQSHKPVLTICWNIHVRHLFPSNNLPVPSTKVNRTFSPSPWASSTPPLIVPYISKLGNLPTDSDLLCYCLGGRLLFFFHFREGANGSWQILWYLVRLVTVLKVSHRYHICSFWPMWVLWWLTRSERWLKLLPHWAHG